LALNYILENYFVLSLYLFVYFIGRKKVYIIIIINIEHFTIDQTNAKGPKDFCDDEALSSVIQPRVEARNIAIQPNQQAGEASASTQVQPAHQNRRSNDASERRRPILDLNEFPSDE